MIFLKNTNVWVKSTIERYREYVLLNWTLIIAILSAMFISAFFAQAIREQTGYVNAALTIIVSYVVYYLVFGILLQKQ